MLVPAAIEVAKVRRHSQQEAQLIYTQIRTCQVRFSVSCEGGLNKKFQNVERKLQDAVPEHEFLALGKAINRGNEPQQELIVGFDGRAGALGMVSHDILEKVGGFAPKPPKAQRSKKAK